jgi:hypothetical protein
MGATGFVVVDVAAFVDEVAAEVGALGVAVNAGNELEDVAVLRFGPWSIAGVAGGAASTTRWGARVALRVKFTFPVVWFTLIPEKMALCTSGCCAKAVDSAARELKSCAIPVMVMDAEPSVATEMFKLEKSTSCKVIPSRSVKNCESSTC